MWPCPHEEISSIPTTSKGLMPRAFSCKSGRCQKGQESFSPQDRGWTTDPGLGSSARGDMLWGQPALSGCRDFFLGIPGTRDGWDPEKGVGGEFGVFPYL